MNIDGKTKLIFDFSPESELRNWFIVDDGVMGGRSKGQFSISEEGHGVFQGKVSLENYGGFSSLRHRFAKKEIARFSTIAIRVKGDGKRYQFRTKANANERYSYITYFETSGDWETIKIPLSDLYPSFRGRKLEMPNFPGEFLEEIAFLIANKKAETFRLNIDWIRLE